MPGVHGAISLITQCYSKHDCVEQLIPYLIFKNDVLSHHQDTIRNLVSNSIKLYKKNINVPIYIPNPRLDYGTQSASEWQANLMFYGDYGSIHNLTKCKDFELDFTDNMDFHIDKVIDSTDESPTVVKEFISEDDLNSGNDSFYDANLDKTDYSVLDIYDTPDSIITYLTKHFNMTPKQAYTAAPFFMKKKRPVQQGDYASLTVNGNVTYYKRINDQWKLDETKTIHAPECTDVTFRLKEHILTSYSIAMYASKLDRDTAIEKKLSKLTTKATAMVKLNQSTTLKYNDAFRDLGRSNATIIVSPNESLLLYILQKPIDDRYVELACFINDRTRVAIDNEDINWLYCSVTGLKLLPVVFVSILDGYNNDQYEETLYKLKSAGLLRDVDASIVTVHGGVVVAPLQFSETFDDVVRTSEFSEDVIITFHRPEHVRTPILLDILSKLSILIKTDVSHFFNYMVYKLIPIKSSIVSHAAAFVLKVANLETNLDIADKLPIILKRASTFEDILVKFSLPQETITETSIMKELISISTYYEIQMISRNKLIRREIRQKATSSTTWTMFLPPANIQPSKHPPIEILREIQTFVQSSPLSLDDVRRINTISGPYEPIIKPILTRIKPQVLSIYTKDVMYIPTKYPLLETDKTFRAVELSRPSIILPTKPMSYDYSNMIPVIRDDLSSHGIVVPTNFIKIDTSLTYMRTFIRDLARVYPKYLTSLPHIFRYPIPLSMEQVVIKSRTHPTTLRSFLIDQPFTSLKAFADQRFSNILIDEEIGDIIQNIERPTTDLTIYEYEYYIYLIFKKYMMYGQSANKIISFFIKRFIKDNCTIFLSVEEIRQKTSRDRAIESTTRHEKRLNVPPGELYMQDYRQAHNLDEEARLGRLRTYDATQQDVEFELFSSKDIDMGDSGDSNFE